VSLKPVVTPQYISDLISAVDSRTKLPDPNDYLPPLAESQVNPSDVSFKPDVHRKTLFSGKQFIFLSASQYKKLNAVISSAGGMTALMDESVDVDTEQSRLVVDGTCVMSCDITPDVTDARKVWLQRVLQLLARSGRRMITESEVGFAVLYCSTSQFCNPAMTPETRSAALPMQSFSVPVVSQMPASSQHPVSQMPHPPLPASSQHPITQIPRSVVAQVKQEPVSQDTVTRPAVALTSKRIRVENSENVDADQHRTKQARLDCIPNTEIIDSTNVNSTVALPAVEMGLHQHEIQEYSASVKVESTFVADSMVTDSKYTDNSDDIVPVNNGGLIHQECHPAVEVADANIRIVSNSSKGSESTDGQSKRVGNSQGRKTLLEMSHVDDDDDVSCHQRVDTRLKEEQAQSCSSNQASGIMSRANITNDIQLNIPEGFLSARIPITIRRDPDCLMEVNLPVGAVVTEDCSLVVQRVLMPASSQNNTVSNCSTTWKGQQVKNFKRFKKSSAFSLLPRCIIGGRDLVVYNEITPQQQEWFENGLQAERTSNNTNKLSQELFNWEPPKRRK
jgi:nijmegen breakage syndrome protein 1